MKRSVYMLVYIKPSVPAAAWSKSWICGRSPADITGSNPTGAQIFFCCDFCVLSDVGLCDDLITFPEKSCQV
jgi:hypothetical protein